MIMEALDSKRLKYNKTIFQIHVTLGAREGSSNSQSGLCGLSWDRFKKNFTRVDLYESKVRGGICWRDCPLNLFFDDLPKQLKTLWKDRDCPVDKKLIIGNYRELRGIYKEIRQALAEYYEGKLDPSLFKELTTIRPHDANKIHVNLLWEAGISLEVIAGEYLGHGEGIGLTGRGWLDINTIKKHYLSLTQRSEGFKRLLRQIRLYSRRFNGRN